MHGAGRHARIHRHRPTTSSAGTASDTHALTFDDCRRARGQPAGAARSRVRAVPPAILDDGRIAIAALAVGLAQACLDESASSTPGPGAPSARRSARTPGRGLPDQPTSRSRSRPARLLTYKAAWLKDAQPAGRSEVQAGGRQSGQAATSSEAAVAATRTATQVFGGYGFMEEYPVAPLLPGCQGSGDRRRHLEVQRMLIACGLGLPVRERFALPESGTPVRTGGAWSRSRPRARRRCARRRERRKSLLAKGSATSATASALLLDDGTFVEDGQLANAPGFAVCPPDGVVTGTGLADGRPARRGRNDPTVKAGSWGARTVEKIIRITETGAGRGASGVLARSTRPARASPTRSTCSPAGAARAASSTTRSRCPARCRRSAACSARRPPAARTSRASATS